MRGNKLVVRRVQRVAQEPGLMIRALCLRNKSGARLSRRLGRPVFWVVTGARAFKWTLAEAIGRAAVGRVDASSAEIVSLVPWWVLQPCAVAVARSASATESESGSDLGAFHQPRRSLLSANQDIYTHCPLTASIPKPEGGARCVSSAGRDWARDEEQSLP